MFRPRSTLGFYRILAGKSQMEVARAVGLAQSTFSGYERGEADAAPAIREKIAAELAVPVSLLWPELDSPAGEPGESGERWGADDGR